MRSISFIYKSIALKRSIIKLLTFAAFASFTMNTKIAVIFAVFLLIAAVGITQADWLDDLNEGTVSYLFNALISFGINFKCFLFQSQVVNAVNENAEKINKIATNIDVLGKMLRNLDPDTNEEE